ncbi:MAG TPA: hypothetical protein H9722_04560 [Candidatus Mediterraneibacter pullistercoris]|nr:hypothetical protein [Candidatus Mediterraneibacter pullistercoris]
MSTLLVWREKLQELYARYSAYILKILQLLLGFILFGLINTNIGFMEMASSLLCTAGLAVICTFFPMIVMVMAATALVLVHFYTLSMPIAIVSLVIFLLVYIFYFRFTPKKAWIVLLSVIAFSLKIPFVIPIVFGLVGTPVWIVPAACGVISYYMVDYVKDSATALRSADADSMANSLMSFTRQVLTSKEMWLMAAAVVVGILVVNLVRTRSIDHAWKIGSAAGAVVCVITASAGNVVLDLGISYVTLVVSAVLGIAVGLVLEFMFFSVDYSRTENIQFEDDEYYYYVKAVPKVGVSVPEKEVKRITGRKAQEQRVDGQSGQIGENNPRRQPFPGKNREVLEEHVDTQTEDILLTRSLSKELGLRQEYDKTE